MSEIYPPSGEDEHVDEEHIQFAKDFLGICKKNNVDVACFIIAKPNGVLSGGGEEGLLDYVKGYLGRNA